MSANYRILLPRLAVFLLILLPFGAWAHHGWAWADGEEAEVTGVVSAVKLGNPHGELTLQVGDQIWIAQVGQPWRNERAGLTPEMLREGVTLTIHGHRSAREGENLIKAERVIINGQSYNLYPGRES